MQINRITYHQIMPSPRNFKGSSENTVSSPFSSSASYGPPSIESSKAYASPQITEGYREIETFDIPYIGKSKLYELSNGHKIILIPKMGQTLIHTYVGAGYINEPTETKETSHLLEHLLGDYCFMPKDERTKEFLSKTGAESNAHTNRDFTGYYIRAALEDDNDFENLVKIQANTLQNTNFTDKDIDHEKKIVTQELESRDLFACNYSLARKTALQNLFNLNDSDPSVNSSTKETIQNIKKEDLINYYNTFYRPDNMVTTVIGPADENSIKTIAKHFNNIQPSQKPTTATIYPKLNTDNLIQETVRKDIQSLDKNSEKAYIDLEFLGPKNNDPDGNLLTNTLEFALIKRISDFKYNNKTFDTTDIGFGSISSDKNAPSVFFISNTCDDENVEDRLKQIYSIITDLAQNPVSEEELNTIKYNYKNDFTHYAEDSLALSNNVSESCLLSSNFDMSKELKMVDSISAQDIQDAAKKYLDLNKASIVVVHPQEKKKDNVSFKGKANDLDMEDIHEYVLPNNLRVVVDSRPGIARTTIKFDLNSQKLLYCNPEACWFLLSRLVPKETRHKMQQQDISINHDGNAQYLSTTINGNTEKTMEMLTVALGIILHPDLDEEDFNQAKKNLVDTDFDNLLGSTEDCVRNEFFKGDPFIYKPGSIKSLELQDVKNLHQEILKNAQGTVFITIPQEELNKHKNEIFQTLMQVPTLKPYNYDTIFNKYKPLPLDKNKVFTTEKEGNQIEVEQIYKIIESGNIQDRAGLMLLNSVLGGDEKSKLYEKLRNKDDLSYSAGSSYKTDFASAGLAEINLLTTVSADNKDNLHTVISEFNNSINELTSEPIKEEELNKAKAKTKGSILRDLETSADRNETISKGYNSYYGASYQQALFEAIDGMTPEYLQQLAQHYFNQPYLISVKGNKEVLDANKDYLSSLGKQN